MNALVINDFPEDERVELTLTVDGTATGNKNVAQGWMNPEQEVQAMDVFKFYPPEGETITAITTYPTEGKVILNDDNSITVQLVEFSTSGNVAQTLVYDTDMTTGITENYEIRPPQMIAGWHNGDTCFFPTDASGNQIFEKALDHRNIYISLAGLDAATIAATNGVSEGAISGSWLRDNIGSGQSDFYGNSEALALNFDLGQALMASYCAGENRSCFVYLLRGDDFESFGSFGVGNSSGLNDRFPVVITSYGTGAKPRLTLRANTPVFNYWHVDIEVIDSTFDQYTRGGFERVSTQNNARLGQSPGATSLDDPDSDGLVFYRCQGFEAYKTEPDNGVSWQASLDRVTPFFVARTKNLLFKQNISDLAGWRPGYDETTNADSDPFFMVPSQYSQGGYMKLSFGSTVIQNLFSRAALAGSQNRSGAHFLENLLILNNAGGNVAAGNYDEGADQFQYNRSILARNVQTKGGFKVAAPENGLSLTGGSFELLAGQVALVDNAALHLESPGGFNTKDPIQEIGTSSVVYDNTKEYAWNEDRNLEGLNTADLDNLTIERFTDEQLSLPYGTSGYDEFIAMLKDSEEPWVILDAAMKYFQEGLGILPAARAPATIVFNPFEHGDGQRADMFYNWSQQPISGDDWDLRGYTVRLGCDSMVAGDLDFGGGGKLTINNSRLDVATLSTADGPAILEVERCGELAVSGAAAPADTLTLSISTDTNDSSAGRVAVTGSLAGMVDCTIGNHGCVVAYDGGDITINGTWTVDGADALLGFDGASGASTITMGAGGVLVLSGSAGDVPHIREIWSGKNLDPATTPTAIESSFVCGGTLDVSGLPSGTHTVISADSVSGTFSNVVDGVVNYTATNVQVTV